MSSWRALANHAGASAMKTRLSASSMALRRKSRNRENAGYGDTITVIIRPISPRHNAIGKPLTIRDAVCTLVP
jgi:hypothetical protein